MDQRTEKLDPEDMLRAMARGIGEEGISEEFDLASGYYAPWVKRAKKAQELYEAGTPFYTKEAIRDLDQQIQAIRQNESVANEVTVTDLEGNSMQLPLPVEESPCKSPQFIKSGEPMGIIV